MNTAKALCESLREKGFAVTPQRRTIFEVLEGNWSHPSAEEVYEEVRKRLPEVSLATVYKVLKELVGMGEVLELNFRGDRSRYDPNTHTHSHLQCDSCGRLTDVDQEFADLKLSRRQAAGFQITRHEVVFHGLCSECRSP